MTVDASLQIRKLPPSHITQLSIILDFSEQWKKLMAVIPNKLEKENFQCFISCENPAKYNADHMRLIEAATVKYKKTGTEILLDEWGCSGKVRPSIGHLLQLLLKAELYRAADYVSERILMRTAIKRPSLGPAAQIPVNINGNIEDDLNNMKIPSSLINDLRVSSFDNNLDYDHNGLTSIPQIVVTPDADELAQSPCFQENESVSDNMAASLQNVNVSDQGVNVENESKAPIINEPYIPQISALLSNSNNSSTQSRPSINSSSENTLECDNSNSQPFVPNLSGLNQTADNSNKPKDNNDCLLPDFSALNQSESEINVSTDPLSSNYLPSINISNTSNGENNYVGNLPDISGLINMTSSESNDLTASNHQESAKHNSPDQSKEENVTAIAENESNSSIPNLNILMADSGKLTVNTFDSSKSRKCNSPLPNLTLTTHLPHYTYERLSSCTNGFNEDAFEGVNKTGRLLGAGAFGKVFLATGILPEPVAVKKILLGNAEAVDVDDRVTKQFITEVEVLSQFRHKNLVSLLGFSCDGCTYCLLYEYISGGTLKDRLQSKSAKLTMQERLSIALGTANAITYLHTAFSSPLIHRDVKTANILLDDTNKPKLGDFGITTLLDNQSMNTTTVIGTSAYMAPEAMRGDISIKCDTFSFGVVLLELLTSLAPYDENRDGHDLITHVEDNCEGSVLPLLDTSIGSWEINNVNFADEIFSIACQCIEEKKKRPIMVDVCEMLMIIISKM